MAPLAAAGIDHEDSGGQSSDDNRDVSVGTDMSGLVYEPSAGGPEHSSQGSAAMTRGINLNKLFKSRPLERNERANALPSISPGMQDTRRNRFHVRLPTKPAGLGDKQRRVKIVALQDMRSARREAVTKQTQLRDSQDHLSDQLDNPGTPHMHTCTEVDASSTIHLLRHELAGVSIDDLQWQTRILHLATALWRRFKSSGSKDDLSEAVQLFRSALIGSDHWHSFPLPHLLDFGICLEFWYQHTGSEQDLEEIITIYRQVVSASTPVSPHWALTLSRLCRALQIRFDCSNRLEDIYESMARGSSAIAASAQDGQHYSDALFEYAQAATSFAKRCPTEGKEYASSIHEGLTLTAYLRPIGHPGRSDVLFALFHLHIEPHSPFYDESFALTSLKEAVTHTRSGAHARLHGALAALDVFVHGDAKFPDNPNLLLDIYLDTISLMPRVALLGFSLHDQIRALQASENIAASAALCAIRCKRYDVAFEVMEEARAVFWAQALRMRTTFDKLPSNYRMELSSLARSLETRMLTAQTVELPRILQEQEAQMREKQLARFENLVDEVRQLPGFSRFLLPPEQSTLYQAASEGFVVTLISTQVASLALVLLPNGQVCEISLPLISLGMLQDMSQKLRDLSSHLTRGRRQRSRHPEVAWRQLYQNTSTHAEDVLGTLWTNVVRVIFDRMNLKPSRGRSRPRMWWRPIGAFCFLPLHAAGIYASKAECCADYVVSTYTPCLGSLLKAREGFAPIPTHEVKLLAAAVPQAFETDWPELPGTVDEIREVKKVVPSSMIIHMDSQDGRSWDEGGATIQAIQDHIPAATILHLASHGLQHPDSPLSSGFVMRDGMLTVDRLMKLSLPNAFLAFLSACDTAKGDEKQPDQAIHLAAAMLFTGFKSVVGTMWSIDEDDGILVATEFYRQLLGQGSEKLEAADVAYALDEAIAMLRRKDGHPGRWASYIHLGI